MVTLYYTLVTSLCRHYEYRKKEVNISSILRLWLVHPVLVMTNANIKVLINLKLQLRRCTGAPINGLFQKKPNRMGGGRHTFLKMGEWPSGLRH